MSTGPTLEDYRWLTSAEAEPWLRDVSSGDQPLHKQAARLRQRLSPARAHLVLEQVELRARARNKFAAADRMFFTRLGLEQATDQWVAAYKASRLAAVGRVADLCCGIGGDLVALAPACVTQAVDRDPICLWLAEANLAAQSHPAVVDRTAFQVAEADRWRAEVGGWHIDPDRRSRGRRTSQPEVSSPPLEVLQRLLAECPHAAIKLAPAAEVPERWQAECELEWLGRGGECKQLVAWHGQPARQPGRRQATVVARPTGRDQVHFVEVGSVAGMAGQPVPTCGGLGRYLFEPAAAVLAADLAGCLANRHGLALVSPGSAYFTGDTALVEGLLTTFEVCDVLPLDRKQLMQYFQSRRIGRLEIKKRGIDLSPQKLRSDLKLCGEYEATLIIAPVATRVRAIVAQRWRG